MPLIEWNDILLIGNKEIDSQHHRLVELANELVHTARKSDNPKDLVKPMKALREYTVLHFDAEERFMKSIGYPGLNDHTLEHTNLKNRVKLYQKELFVGMKIPPDEVLGFMKTWLLNHILDMDMKIKAFINRPKETVLPDTSEEKTPPATH